MYEDVSKEKNVRNDKKILKSIWKLLDEADIVVGHNSDQFDVKVLNARFIKNGMKPPSSFKKMDTKKLSKKHFRFMSNKLAYLTDSLCRTKKSSHGKFPGFSMWEQCLKGNKEAFKEMKAYNIVDVTSMEELFLKILPWENSDIFNTYQNEDSCTCGNKKFKKSGFIYTTKAKYQRYKCTKCGSESRGIENLNKYRK
jgi:DNA polymerase elongation subunit (family B)